MWRFQRAKELLDNLDEGCVTYEHRVEIHRCVVRCNFVFMLYLTAYTVYSTMIFLISALSGKTSWVSYNPFVDYRESKKSLWIAATYEFIIGSSAVYTDLNADVFPVIFGLILRTHIELLTRRVQKLRTDPAQTERQSYEELVNCIKDHKLVLQYCELFRPVISRTLFAQLLVIGLSLGLSLVHLLFFSSLLTALTTVLYIFVLLIQTFPFCYVCELINDDCYKLNLAIFYSEWIGASRRYKSTVFFFLQTAQKPITFIAGGMFPINMKTNITFAKFAFSVVAVVKQMNLVEKFKLN
ncbi:odorant receptor 42b-like [Drosophila montana]|uniref:odorant receptor 42b-like n=1 Tax=Drosophila montana TaxID=40370 RepID=UPI00313DD643